EPVHAPTTGANAIADTHFRQLTPISPGTINRAGYPWSGEIGTPLTFSASSDSSADTWLEASVAVPPSSASMKTAGDSRSPTAAARSASRTPVQRWVVDHPSRHA